MPGRWFRARPFIAQMSAAADKAAAAGEALRIDPGTELVVAVDTLVADVHFAADTPAEDVGHKALAVNLSDLAAMGADPRAARASVCHPAVDAGRRWRHGFEAGLRDLADLFGVRMDATLTVRGPLCVTVEAMGSVPAGRALTRAGAAPGDRIMVTGTLGDAGLALEAGVSGADDAWLRQRLRRPEPRVAAGVALRDLASACIDVSDGLAADLGHVLAASGVGARLEVDALPLSPALAAVVPADRALALALGAGDDYELLFTVPPGRLAEAETRLGPLPGGVTVIGTVVAGDGLACLRADGSAFRPPAGYRHFP